MRVIKNDQNGTGGRMSGGGAKVFATAAFNWICFDRSRAISEI